MFQLWQKELERVSKELQDPNLEFTTAITLVRYYYRLELLLSNSCFDWWCSKIDACYRAIELSDEVPVDGLSLALREEGLDLFADALESNDYTVFLVTI